MKIYGIDGDYMATETAQIATQYAYGDGEKRSCQLTREAVSNLLYDIPIHDYLSLICQELFRSWIRSAE